MQTDFTQSENAQHNSPETANIDQEYSEFDIAIIGMSGRFPGADSIEEYWGNLCAGKESITFFSDEELEKSGISQDAYNDPNYVKAAPVLNNPGHFDAPFFGYSPREATSTDPQHRLFLECAWQALESAGYDVERITVPVGVFGGAAMNTYLLHGGLLPEFSTNYLPTLIGNDNSFLATRVSYKLNLTGPSMTIQTACSSSLVAIHTACQSLLNQECDLALAGGVSVRVPHKAGYQYQENSVFSPDGHCRTFDANAQGTIFGSGVGIVILKRLTEAVAEKDNIYAIIKGSAVNNDGASKVDYTAPSVNSQSHVITEAMANAGVTADTISYIEAHGTGTNLGDPIEISALTKAFRNHTEQKQFCAIGSVKTNIGHLDAAAGVAGLIKTVMSLWHKQIPASLHYETPNPQIDFNNSPFFVNTGLCDWGAKEYPRRAGISSLGIGGTNAHIVLEEAPCTVLTTEPKSSAERPMVSTSPELLLLSARTPSALAAYRTELAKYLSQNPHTNLANVACTLREGRRQFDYRSHIVCASSEDAVTQLNEQNLRSQQNGIKAGTKAIVFMFPGQGAQYVDMGRDLYENEDVFRNAVERCAEILHPYLGSNLCDLLYPSQASEADKLKINETAWTQPAIFTVEFAMAQLLLSRGITPTAVIGHSVGEYVAACIAGIFSLDVALNLVAVRGRLIQQQPLGDMLAVRLTEEELQPYLNQQISIAAINSPKHAVVSGTVDAIAQFQKTLHEKGTASQLLHTSHAFHSFMMDPVLNEFVELVETVPKHTAQIPFISTVTGTELVHTEYLNAGYWGDNLRQSVRFMEATAELLTNPNQILVEVGPGVTLSTFARQHNLFDKEIHLVLSSMRQPQSLVDDTIPFLDIVGGAWSSGIEIDLSSLNTQSSAKRIPLPTYPFEYKNYWFSDGKQTRSSVSTSNSLNKQSDISKWLYTSSWQRSEGVQFQSVHVDTNHAENVIVFSDRTDFSSALIAELESKGSSIMEVTAGDDFNHDTTNQKIQIRPDVRADYEKVVEQAANNDITFSRIVHLWTADSTMAPENSTVDTFKQSQTMGYYSLLHLAQALVNCSINTEVRVNVVSSRLCDVYGHEQIAPEKATLVGPIRVIPQEYPNIICQSVDVTPSDISMLTQSNIVEKVTAEILSDSTEPFVAFRNGSRWVQCFPQLELPAVSRRSDDSGVLRDNGVYLITGGLGSIGLILSEHIADSVENPVLLIIGRTELPDRDEWDKFIAINAAEHHLCQRMEKIRLLESKGARVELYTADVADKMQMSIIMEQVNRQHRVNGVIHAAGVVAQEKFTTIENTDISDSEIHFLPKAYGLYTLSEVLQDLDLDFCLLMSSIASILGGIGHTAYTAANAFMDAFVQNHNQNNSVQWTSVDWDIWRYEGTGENLGQVGGASLKNLGIQPSEGKDVFDLVLSLKGVSSLLVSTSNLDARIMQWQSPTTSENNTDYEEQSYDTIHLADNGSQVDGPRNDTEKRVAQVWRKHLGLENVGIYDSFTDLGGHSLLATQVIANLRSEFNTVLTIKDLFSYSTIARLAEHIDSMASERQQVENDLLSEALNMIGNLSEEEVKRLLEE